jgi:hypothetical protein
MFLTNHHVKFYNFSKLQNMIFYNVTCSGRYHCGEKISPTQGLKNGLEAYLFFKKTGIHLAGLNSIFLKKL